MATQTDLWKKGHDFKKEEFPPHYFGDMQDYKEIMTCPRCKLAFVQEMEPNPDCDRNMIGAYHKAVYFLFPDGRRLNQENLFCIDGKVWKFFEANLPACMPN